MLGMQARQPLTEARKRGTGQERDGGCAGSHKVPAYLGFPQGAFAPDSAVWWHWKLPEAARSLAAFRWEEIHKVQLCCIPIRLSLHTGLATSVVLDAVGVN